MAGQLNIQIPVLTEAVARHSSDNEALIAELQTEIAASTFALTDDIMRKAFAEMEASIFEQISGRLRRELPDLIDQLLRERLSQETDV